MINTIRDNLTVTYIECNNTKIRLRKNIRKLNKIITDHSADNKKRCVMFK